MAIRINHVILTLITLGTLILISRCCPEPVPYPAFTADNINAVCNYCYDDIVSPNSFYDKDKIKYNRNEIEYN